MSGFRYGLPKVIMSLTPCSHAGRAVAHWAFTPDQLDSTSLAGPRSSKATMWRAPSQKRTGLTTTFDTGGTVAWTAVVVLGGMVAKVTIGSDSSFLFFAAISCSRFLSGPLL